MTSYVDIVNRALAALGTRTTVSTAEMQALTSNEAIQASLLIESVRDDVARAAPWDCCLAVENASIVCASPGTLENTDPPPLQWRRGLPTPPWAYEYAYPSDCLRFIEVLPNQYGNQPTTYQPIATGYALYPGAPTVPHKIATEKLYSIASVAVGNGGLGHAVGDILTLAAPVAGDFSNGFQGMPGGFSPISTAPAGSPAEVLVTAVGPQGVITGAAVFLGPTGSIYDLTTFETDPTNSAGYLGGGYFTPIVGAQPQSATSGSGINATFFPTVGPRTSKRVILTNQPQAMLRYVRQVIDPNVMDPLFIEAWVELLAARLCMALLGDKALANQRIQLANAAITTARVVDGNESRDIIDVLPDWIRARGIAATPTCLGYDWGPLWPNV